MKKVIVFLCAFVFALGFVNAEITVDGNASQNVTVGDVETPVYEVLIGWENFVYDWAYQADTGEYGWRVHPTCDYASIENEAEFEAFDKTLYSEDTCTTQADGTYNSNNEYYYLNYEISPVLWIEDQSTGGKVTPSIAYTAANGYDFTTMSFTYHKKTGGSGTLTSGVIPDDARYCMKGELNGVPLECEPEEYMNYTLSPVIGIDTTKTITTPTAGATIGTITLTFAAN